MSTSRGIKRKTYTKSFCFICGRKEDSSVTHFKFPKNDTRSAWFEFVNLPEDSDDTHLYLCSKHFADADLKKETGRYMLRKSAVPTLLSSISKTYRECPRRIRCVLCKGNKANASSIRFPHCIELRKRWANFCSIPVEDITSYTFLCSRHFQDDDFIAKRWMKDQPRMELKAMTVPSIHLGDEYKITSKSQRTYKRHYCYVCGYNDNDESYFKFPKTEEQNCKWRQICNLSDNMVTNKLFVCGRHFAEDEKIIHLKRTNLKDTAIPTLDLGRFSDVGDHTYTSTLCGPLGSSVNSSASASNTRNSITSSTTEKKVPCCSFDENNYNCEQNTCVSDVNYILPEQNLTLPPLLWHNVPPVEEETSSSKHKSLGKDGNCIPEKENLPFPSLLWHNIQPMEEEALLSSRNKSLVNDGNFTPEKENFLLPPLLWHNVQPVEERTSSCRNKAIVNDGDAIPEKENVTPPPLVRQGVQPTEEEVPSLRKESPILGKEMQTSRTQSNSVGKLLRYFGDVQLCDLLTPSRAKLCWTIAQRTVKEKNQQIRRQQQHIATLKKKISSLCDIVEQLQFTQLIPKNVAELSIVDVSDVCTSCLTNELQNCDVTAER